MDEFRNFILFVAEAIQILLVIAATLLLGWLFSNFAFIVRADRFAGFAVGALIGFSISALFVHISICLAQTLRAAEENTQLLEQLVREAGLNRVHVQGCWTELIKLNQTATSSKGSSA